MYVIKDKVAIVTGGAGGTAKATVEAILEKGGLPVIADWNVEMGEATAGELGVPFIQTDVSNEENR